MAATSGLQTAHALAQHVFDLGVFATMLPPRTSVFRTYPVAWQAYPGAVEAVICSWYAPLMAVPGVLCDSLRDFLCFAGSFYPVTWVDFLNYAFLVQPPGHREVRLPSTKGYINEMLKTLRPCAETHTNQKKAAKVHLGYRRITPEGIKVRPQERNDSYFFYHDHNAVYVTTENHDDWVKRNAVALRAMTERNAPMMLQFHQHDDAFLLEYFCKMLGHTGHVPAGQTAPRLPYPKMERLRIYYEGNMNLGRPEFYTQAAMARIHVRNFEAQANAPLRSSTWAHAHGGVR